MTGSIKRSKQPYLIGVAGGSGSGKTFFAKELQRRLPGACEIVYQDSFYIDQSSKFDFDGGSVNFDHPDAVDFALLKRSLERLKQGLPADIPVYDFASHTRRRETVRIQPAPLVLVDGILIFHVEGVRGLFDELVFFDTPEELRFQRRLERDIKERGRTAEGVRQQFYRQVKPMHDQFVEPSKKFASTVVGEPGDLSQLIESFARRLPNHES